MENDSLVSPRAVDIDLNRAASNQALHDDTVQSQLNNNDLTPTVAIDINDVVEKAVEEAVLDLNQVPEEAEHHSIHDVVEEEVEEPPTTGHVVHEILVDNTEVDNVDQIPTVGMSFVSGDEFAMFCHKYAHNKGFEFFYQK